MAFNLDVELDPIVLDNGSGTIQIGIAGDDAPKAVIPNIIGSTIDTTTPKELFIGDKALKHRNLVNLRYPMEHGIVTDWDSMETIWRYALHERLGLASLDRPILISETPMNPIGNREKMAQIFFEHLQAPAIHIGNSGILAFFYLGRITGIVVDSGDGVTYTQFICEGRALRHTTNRIDFAGRDLTDYLARLLAERGYSFTTTAEREIVRDMKEKLAYVALDFEEELSRTNCSKKKNEVKYELPDGQKISIGNERFRCTEALFRPKSIGISELGITEMLYDAIMKADVDFRSDLYYTILISGGTTLLTGFAERLQKEIRALIPSTERTSVLPMTQRNYSVWTGGSIIASLSSFQQMWITKQDYDEFGPTIVHRKCI